MPHPFRSSAILRFLLCMGLLVAGPALAKDSPALASAKAAFAKADRELNEAWAAVKKAWPAERFSELKEVQREWVKYREDQTGVSSSEATAESFQEAVVLTTARADWLRARVQQREDAVSGFWFDGRGGTVEVVEQTGRLFFVCRVVRGSSFHLGQIAGVAAWNERIGWFSDKGRSAEKTEETNLSFTHRDGTLEIIGANTHFYHGQRAYFDGVYFKASALSAREKEAVVKAGEAGKVPEP